MNRAHSSSLWPPRREEIAGARMEAGDCREAAEGREVGLWMGAEGRWEVGVRERGIKMAPWFLARATGRKELVKNGGGAGVGVEGIRNLASDLVGGRRLFNALSRQLVREIWESLA